MTTAQLVEASVTANNNSPIQDYVHPDDQIQPTFDYRFCYSAISQFLMADMSFNIACKELKIAQLN